MSVECRSSSSPSFFRSVRGPGITEDVNEKIKRVPRLQADTEIQRLRRSRFKWRIEIWKHHTSTHPSAAAIRIQQQIIVGQLDDFRERMNYGLTAVICEIGRDVKGPGRSVWDRCRIEVGANITNGDEIVDHRIKFDGPMSHVPRRGVSS